MKNRFYLILLSSLFLAASLLRFYKLGQVPYGFYQDESAIGYNAYSVLETGRDEYGKNLPLYFKSFGDYKSPLYIYLTTLPIKIFGLNEFAVRFSSAFFGFLTVILFYFFTLELTKNRELAFISSLLLTFNPWHLHYNRATFEVSISLFLYVLGGLLLLNAFTKRLRWGLFLGTLCFVLAVYSYNLTRFLTFPLYFLCLFFFKKEIRTEKKILLFNGRKGFISKMEIILTLIFSLALLSPFILTLFGEGGTSSARGTLIFSSKAVQAPLLELRSYLISFPFLFTKIFYNQVVLTAWQYINNVFAYLSPSFFFISGSSHGNHGIGNVGQFYLFELPLIILGIYKIVKEKMAWGQFLIVWSITVVLVAALTRDVPHATRSFFLIIPVEVFSALGVLMIIHGIRSVRNNLGRLSLVLFLLIFILYNLLFYFISYYVRFPVFYAKSWHSEDKKLSFYLKENESKYKVIIFDGKAGFAYTSLLFYLGYNPKDFPETVQRYPDDPEGFSKVKSFGKYVFKDVDWSKDYKIGEKTLIITTPDRKPEEVSPLRTLYYPKRPVVFSIKEEIVQYPVEEIAYVLVESP